MNRRLAVAIAASAVFFAGCGGGGGTGGGGGMTAPTQVPTSATPTIAPSVAPSPAPTATPTAGPTTLVVDPGSMQFTYADQKMPFTAKQTNFSGAYTVVATGCASSIATIAPSSSTTGTFAVTAVGAGGPCTFTIQGATGVTASLSVNVATTGGGISIVPAAGRT